MELTSRTFLFSLHSALTPLPLVQISLGPGKTWQIKTEQIAPTLDPRSSMVFVSILNLHLMGGYDTENFPFNLSTVCLLTLPTSQSEL